MGVAGGPKEAFEGIVRLLRENVADPLLDEEEYARVFGGPENTASAEGEKG